MICNVNVIGNVKMQLLLFTALVKLKQTHSKSCIRAELSWTEVEPTGGANPWDYYGDKLQHLV